VNVVRSLEKRLEKIIEGVAGKVFSGRLHPSELAGKLAREADFARFEHSTGPATANVYIIEVNPRDLTVEPSKLEAMLAAEMTAYTSEEGLRLEGPVEVRIQPSSSAPSGRAECHVEVLPGEPVIWARLVARDESYDVGRNRAIVGRSPDADVVIPHDDISRRHALVYREKGQTWVRDLSSANGSSVDGESLGHQVAAVQAGSVVRFAGHRYRLVEV